MKTTLRTDNYNGQLQSALGSGFNSTSTAADVMEGIDLNGKVAVVTGGYAGIGLETVRAFVRAGAEVWVPARDIAKAEKNIGSAGVTVKAMDLMNPASIDQFAATFLSTGKSLDILVNNAGIMWVPLRRDDRGFESQLATNHLGHFQLTARLWPALKRAGSARVVTVSSYGHHMAPFDFADPNFNHREYHTLQGYGQSKTANNLFAVELDRRGQEFGVRAYSLHPGSVNGTDLGREAPIELFKQMGTHDADGNIFPDVARRLKTIAQGAATTVWCATSPLLNDMGGVYCENCDIAQLDKGDIEQKYDDPFSLRGVLPYSVDANNARALWTMTEEMTNLQFPVE
ncbi:MAG TPA: SDR family NAD(P)-dependent oxidoreductase [Chryseolinea sp.]|nr:SDR family NAD(P)-dependent oxidoreductase [Chryseolinea sp.]